MHRFSLREQGDPVGVAQPFCVAKKIGERRKGPGGHSRCRRRLQVFDALGVNGHAEAERLGGGGEEGRLALIALDELNPCLRGPLGGDHGDNEAGEAAAAAKVAPKWRSAPDQTPKLGGVDDVSLPDVLEAAGADQVYAAIPATNQTDEMVQPIRCFT
jgi:hypothetical protein